MSYTPTDWKTGDVITAEKLNNMESGIENAGNTKVFDFEVITDNYNQVVTEVTKQEVLDAYNEGKHCIARILIHAKQQPIEYSSKYEFPFTLYLGDFGVDQMFLGGTKIDSITIIHCKLFSNNGSTWIYSEDSFKLQLVST